MGVRRSLAAYLFGFACLAASAPADARMHAHVEWTRIDVPDGSDSARVGRRLRALLNEAASKADFGKSKNVAASVRVVELSWQTHGDIVRMTCAVVGHLKDGPSARSRISFGGDPAKKDDLEKQVLTSVSSGLVARLAQLARTRDD
jgi:hypothetical protein